MSETLSEVAFERAADVTLRRLERSLGDDPDLEVDLSMGILSVEFSDGTKYVVNSHRAARQIWMAAERSAWHFDPVGDPEAPRWIAAKSGDELGSTLTASIAKKLGRPVAAPDVG